MNNNIKLDDHFNMELLDIEGFIKANDIQEINDPIFFVRDNIPTPTGLLSNEIFGITKEERSNIFGYIDLSEYFMHPLIYKLWSRMDSNIRECVHGTSKFIIDSSGYLVKSDDGETGIKFIKKNIDKIKIKSSESSKRDTKIKFIYNNKNKIFVRKYLVIPAFYRDVNSSSKNTKKVGEVNKLYQSLILGVRSIKESNEYGFDLSNANCGRIQETLVSIYDWFSGNSNTSIEGGSGMSKKKGILQYSVLSKTTDYSSRLVLTAPNLSVEYADDIACDLDYCMIPLSTAITIFKPFVLFHVKRFFENLFNEASLFPYNNEKTNKIEFGELDNPFIEFSDERIEEELKRYIYGYSNRLIPIKIPFKDKSLNKYLSFKGFNSSVYANTNTSDNIIDDKINNTKDKTIIGRRMTWMDVFYIAATKAVENRHVLITRYPIDTCYNQVPLKPIISTTYTTNPIWYNNTFYKYYPNIKDSDIGTDTSDKFIDTMIMSNLIIKIMGGDYDGDTVSVKGVWSVEANDELDKYLKSKANFVDLGAGRIRYSSQEAVQSIYDLTKVLVSDRLVDPVF